MRELKMVLHNRKGYYMTKKENAAELFHGGFNCAASVLASFCEDYDLDTELALKLACGLGGGFQSGEICGAVSAAILVVGLKYGQYVMEDLAAKANCRARASQIIEGFREKHGALTCRDLLGCDITTVEGRETALEKKPFCAGLVGSAVELLEELGY